MRKVIFVTPGFPGTAWMRATLAAVLLMLAAAFACGCAPRARRAPAAAAADSVLFAPRRPHLPTIAETEAQIETTLTNFSLALAAGDTAMLRDLTAPEFALLEDGRVYDLDGTIASALQALESGTMIRTPVDFVTSLRGSVAWTRYHVVGELRTDRKRLLVTRLETAVLERRAGEWRIVQMSSLPEAAP
jgi:hypothetical protein